MTNKTIKRLFSFLIIGVMSSQALADDLVQVRSASGRITSALPNQILVKYKSGRAQIGLSSLSQKYGASVAHTIATLDVHVLRVPAGESLQGFLERLEKDPDVEFAEPNGVVRAVTAPNDPSYASQYSLLANTTDVEGAWDITQGTASVVIAVIDTGITLTHPDLIANLWTNPAPSGNSGLHGTRIGIDWNNDGDYNDTDPQNGPDQSPSSDPTDNNSVSNEYHGTRVSGISAAVTNNGVNIAGVARNCKIMAVKALNSAGSGTFSGVAEAINYAVANGASVINMSLGAEGGSSQTVLNAVNAAVAANVVLVAAAGNLQSGVSCAVNFPASISSVIAVGATDSSNVITFFSCTGNSVDLVAPGDNILATIAPNGTSTGDGTSFSSPIVAGVAALIRSLDPAMTVADVTRYLTFTVTDLGSSGFDTTYGYGLLNAKRAVEAARDQTDFIYNPADPGKTFPYPNPFRPGASQQVTFAFPVALGNQGLEVDIYSIAGEKIKTLTGTNVWDGRNDDGNYVASGFYIYIARTSLGESTGKLTVLK
jgi:subtilisin family serine protease